MTMRKIVIRLTFPIILYRGTQIGQIDFIIYLHTKYIKIRAKWILLYLESHVELILIPLSICSLGDILDFKPVRESDGGSYFCWAKNEVGTSDELSVTFDVLYPPRTVTTGEIKTFF